MIGLAELEGRWRLSRVIEDRRAGLSGALAGTCTWARNGAGLVQEEEGLLHFGDAAPMRARRTYLWRCDGEGLVVLFEDGRPFHRIAPDRLSDTHICPPDTYEVTYTFRGPAGFSTAWRVTGPRKALFISSSYSAF